MKKLFALFIFLLCCFLASAQQNMEDVLYLKSGKVVRGIILEQNNNGVKILVLGRYKFIYATSEIDKMTKEPSTSNYTYTKTSTRPTVAPVEQKPVSPSGYYGLIELGYGMQVGDKGYDIGKFNFINGYRFSPHFSAGIGVGLRYYAYDVFEENFFGYSDLIETGGIPVFLDLRAHFSKGNVSPYLVLNAGFTFDSQMFEPNLMISPGAGVKIKVSRKSSFLVGISYDIQEYTLYDFEQESLLDEKLTNVSLNLGFSF